MFFRLSFVTLIFALLTLGTPVKRDLAKVESDINAIGGQLTKLNNAIEALPPNAGRATRTRVQAPYSSCPSYLGV